MKKISWLGLVAIMACLALPAFAVTPTSTVNPNAPAQNSALSSATLRANFLAAYNDINALWTSIYSGVGNVVSSVFGRTGAITAQYGDYSFSQISGTNPIAQGGTGQTNQQAAINALTGSQSSGKYLRSDGTNAALSSILAADVPTLNQNTTGTAANITASSNSSLTTLPSLSLPYSQLTGVPVTGVSSVFSRSGAVTAQSGDYSVGQVTGAAPIASPTFTGTITTPAARISGFSAAGIVSNDSSGNLTTTPRCSLNQFAFIGDSRLAQVTVTNPPQSPRFNGYHWFTLANNLIGNRMFLPSGNIQALSGLRSDQYTASIYTTPVYASNACNLIIYGAVNDIGQNYPTAGTSGSTAYANIKAVADVWTSMGRRVILPTETGATSQAGNSTQVGQTAVFNRLIRQYCTENPNCVLFDVAGVFMDPTQTMAFRTNVSGDGVHPNLVGGVLAGGRAFAQLMAPLVPAYGGLVTTPGEVFANGGVQWFPNPTFQTTTGGNCVTTANLTVSGSQPLGITSCSADVSGSTLTSSIAAGAYGNDWVLAMSMPSGGRLHIQMDLTSIGTENPGDIFTANAEYDVAAGATNFQGCSFQFESNRNASTTFTISNYETTSNGFFDSTAKTFQIQSPPLTVQTGTRGWLTNYLDCYFSGAGSATINLRRVGIWRRQAS